MNRFLSVFAMALCLALGAAVPRAAAVTLPPGGVFASTPTALAFATNLGIEGTILSDAEAAAILGGDARLILNEDRTELQVYVTDNEYEARLGRIPPMEKYTIPVTNEIVDTIRAPFYPLEKFEYRGLPTSFFTTRPVPFPTGGWEIGRIYPRSDNYGPWMIGTNAIGEVDVFYKDLLVGHVKDIGYSLHGTIRDLDVARSYGCIVMSREDNARLAKSLLEDRERDPFTRQTLSVRRTSDWDPPGR